MFAIESLPFLVAGAWLAVACIIEIVRGRFEDVVQYEAAVESAKLMKDWSTWMTGIATAAIAANGVLTRGAVDITFAQISIAMFCVAIVINAWLLGSLPSIIARLKYADISIDNDIYELPIFSFLPRKFFRLGFVAGVQHLVFVVAVYAFAMRVASGKA